MDNFWSNLGGIIGGYTLVQAPMDKVIPGLESVVDIIGAVSMVVFAGMLVYHGVRTMFR